MNGERRIPSGVGSDSRRPRAVSGRTLLALLAYHALLIGGGCLVLIGALRKDHAVLGGGALLMAVGVAIQLGIVRWSVRLNRSDPGLGHSARGEFSATVSRPDPSVARKCLTCGRVGPPRYGVCARCGRPLPFLPQN